MSVVVELKHLNFFNNFESSIFENIVSNDWRGILFIRLENNLNVYVKFIESIGFTWAFEIMFKSFN